MAIAFARARYISRSAGGSAVRSAAYNGREAIRAERTGEVFYFKHREAPEHHEVLLPEGAPSSLSSGDALWNAAEAMEKRKDAQLAREIVLALPANAELGHDDRVELARSFALEHFVSKGLAVQIDVHAPHGAESEGERANFHAHLLITTRRLGEDGFAAKKARDLDPVVKRGGGRAIVAEGEAWGQLWRDHQNRYFAEQGFDIRVDATSAVPQEHIGPVRMRAADAEANRRAEDIRRANEAAARDPEKVLGVLTRNSATFSERDLDRHLQKHIRDDDERAEVKARVLGHDQVLALHDRETGESAGRWTTRTVRDQEREALADGRRVSGGVHRDVGQSVREHLTSDLRPDQLAAFNHAAGPGGLKLVEGRAGTGKSFALGSIRDAHEAAGYRVIGLAPTNAVAQTMADEGFAKTSTVHAELFRLKNGRAQWDRRTLVVVDEAAMMDAKVTGEVLREARLSGAKLVLAGDDRQLGSIERGGLFSELKKEHGSVEITQVMRQKVDWQREAARDLSDGRFEDALRAFARNKSVIWASKQEELRGKLVEQWAKDSVKSPHASRFVFAYTNKDVGSLNADLRKVRRDRGELGEDFVFTTKHGEAAFAVGDRVQFTDTLKGAGIYNGNAGVITRIDRNFGRISVELDAAAGREGRKVEWYASEFNGFRHGYAGTIYKGQGKTLDHTYLMHTHHWRAASSYVALTRQRESATIFVAMETARDLRQLARQIGRNEIKSASVAYATRDELTAEQRDREAQRMKMEQAPAREERAMSAQARAAGAGENATETAWRQGAGSGAGEGTGQTITQSKPVDIAAGDRSSQLSEGPERREMADRGDIRLERNASEPASTDAQVRGQGNESPVARSERKALERHEPMGDDGSTPQKRAVDRPDSAASQKERERATSGSDSPADAAQKARPGILIPAFDGIGADGIRRDSLGRGLDERSVAAAVAGHPDVQREHADRSIYIQTAYRDPKTATERLDAIIANDGATSAARRVSSDPTQLGELRGREGFFASAKSKEERETATRAAAAIGPNVSRTAEAEGRAAQAYRGEVERQMKADATAVPDLSDRAKEALGAVASAKDDKGRAEAWSKIQADKDIQREVEMFAKAVENRFGEDGARAMLRAEAAGTAHGHASVSKPQQSALEVTAKLYTTARAGERELSRQAETERLSERQTQGARMKP